MDDDRNKCEICRRPIAEWLMRLTVEDASGFAQIAYICGNCGVKLRLASEKMRDLQIDPWMHEAVAHVLRGKE
jgi:RNase P subunit RPR2